MAAVTYIAPIEGWGSSFSGTLNLPKEFPAAFAQVALNHVLGGYGQIYITGYSASGNPIEIDGTAVLGISNADSFSFAGYADPNGYAFAWLTAYCFE
jgi:hypothetical protein